MITRIDELKLVFTDKLLFIAREENKIYLLEDIWHDKAQFQSTHIHEKKGINGEIINIACIPYSMFIKYYKDSELYNREFKRKFEKMIRHNFKNGLCYVKLSEQDYAYFSLAALTNQQSDYQIKI